MSDGEQSNAEYMRQYRRDNPGYYNRARKIGKIRQRAALIVAMRYPDELKAEVLRMCEEEGVEPPR